MAIRKQPVKHWVIWASATCHRAPAKETSKRKKDTSVRVYLSYIANSSLSNETLNPMASKPFVTLCDPLPKTRPGLVAEITPATVLDQPNAWH